MKFELFFVVSCVTFVSATRLTPLENNDQLQDVKSRYVAEWQWESWPIKQETAEQDLKAPGPRLNPALWRSTTGTTWYFFGGYTVGDATKSMNSDVWKYSVETRVWENLLPSLHEANEEVTNKKGKKSIYSGKFFGKDKIGYESRIMCGSILELDSSTDDKLKLLYHYTRKKKLEEERKEILRSVAVYTTRGGKSNTVWQIDLKDQIWTTYVCCCDVIGEKNTPFKIDDHISNETLARLLRARAESQKTHVNKTEEQADDHQQHLLASNAKSKKKKINQSKKATETSNKKTKEVQKRNDHLKEANLNSTKNSSSERRIIGARNKPMGLTANKTDSKAADKDKKETTPTSTVEPDKANTTKAPEPKPRHRAHSSDICPSFEEHESTVAWCDGRDELLITADVSTPQIILWAFGLRTSHWSRQEVKIPDDIKWLGCSKKSMVRYAGIEDEIYMFCTPSQEEDAVAGQHPNNTTDPSLKNPSEHFAIKKTVYRINYNRLVLECLGEIQLGSNFNTSEGQEIWRNYSKSILKVVQTPDNDTILILAHSDLVDLWMLSKDENGKYYFDEIENIWRGSALKWFNRYYASLYNLQFTPESGNTETILMTNPRSIADDEYWPRERGRFIIRIFKNENLKNEDLKNETFENRTREQNLTYELLQSDLKSTAGDSQAAAHNYTLKVLVFFGISLGIFAVFGFVAFVKKCVNCPPTIRICSDSYKSPVIIRYSIIPDNLLQPVA